MCTRRVAITAIIMHLLVQGSVGVREYDTFLKNVMGIAYEFEYGYRSNASWEVFAHVLIDPIIKKQFKPTKQRIREIKMEEDRKNLLDFYFERKETIENKSEITYAIQLKTESANEEITRKSFSEVIIGDIQKLELVENAHNKWFMIIVRSIKSKQFLYEYLQKEKRCWSFQEGENKFFLAVLINVSDVDKCDTKSILHLYRERVNMKTERKKSLTCTRQSKMFRGRESKATEFLKIILNNELMDRSHRYKPSEKYHVAWNQGAQWEIFVQVMISRILHCQYIGYDRQTKLRRLPYDSTNRRYIDFHFESGLNGEEEQYALHLQVGKKARRYSNNGINGPLYDDIESIQCYKPGKDINRWVVAILHEKNLYGLKDMQNVTYVKKVTQVKGGNGMIGLLIEAQGWSVGKCNGEEYVNPYTESPTVTSPPPPDKQSPTYRMLTTFIIILVSYVTCSGFSTLKSSSGNEKMVFGKWRMYVVEQIMKVYTAKKLMRTYRYISQPILMAAREIASLAAVQMFYQVCSVIVQGPICMGQRILSIFRQVSSTITQGPVYITQRIFSTFNRLFPRFSIFCKAFLEYIFRLRQGIDPIPNSPSSTARGGSNIGKKKGNSHNDPDLSDDDSDSDHDKPDNNDLNASNDDLDDKTDDKGKKNDNSHNDHNLSEDDFDGDHDKSDNTHLNASDDDFDDKSDKVK